VLGGWWSSGFDANAWWIDTRLLPGLLGDALLITVGVIWLLHAVAPARGGWRRRWTIGLSLVCGTLALSNALTYFQLLLGGTLHGGPLIPLSLPIAGALLLIALVRVRRGGWVQRGTIALSLPVLLVVGVLGLMWTFGKADYRRPADAIVVFGARTYADGRPSDALADRVNTAIALYHDGYAPRLIMSGGPGDGAFHETDTMRQMALDAGVPANAIMVDREGLNTDATVINTAAFFDADHTPRVLAVSHGYHLPRVKLTYQRAGVEAFTVPAHERYLLTKMPWLMAREVAAWWVYYARPLV